MKRALVKLLFVPVVLPSDTTMIRGINVCRIQHRGGGRRSVPGETLVSSH